MLAELQGGSFTCDAHHMTVLLPDGVGMRLCIEQHASHAARPSSGSSPALRL